MLVLLKTSGAQSPDRKKAFILKKKTLRNSVNRLSIVVRVCKDSYDSYSPWCLSSCDWDIKSWLLFLAFNFVCTSLVYKVAVIVYFVNFSWLFRPLCWVYTIITIRSSEWDCAVGDGWWWEANPRKIILQASIPGLVIAVSRSHVNDYQDHACLLSSDRSKGTWQNTMLASTAEVSQLLRLVWAPCEKSLYNIVLVTILSHLNAWQGSVG